MVARALQLSSLKGVPSALCTPPFLSLASLARRTPQPQQAFLGKSPHKAGAMLSLAGVTSRDKTGARDSPFMLHLWCQAFCWVPPPSLLPGSFVARKKNKKVTIVTDHAQSTKTQLIHKAVSISPSSLQENHRRCLMNSMRSRLGRFHGRRR